MQSLIDFVSLSDPNTRYVVLGSILLGCSAAVVGSFLVLRKRALVGDAIAHSVLPGVCLAFIATGTKNPFVLLLGAFVTGWLSLATIDYITRKTRIKEDTAIGLVLSVFFGVGIVLLTAIQQSGNASQSGLDKFLFGKAASLLFDDVLAFGSIAIVLLTIVWLFFKEFALLAFDKDFASAIGIPLRLIELLLTTITVLAVVVGIQAVGVVLMAALLITPAAAARYWTERLHLMIVLAGVFGMFSGIAGAYISTIAPAMPTGPWVVVVVSGLFFLSLLFAPERGIASRLLRYRSNRHRMTNENILKALYHLDEEIGVAVAHSTDDILWRRNMPTAVLSRGLNRLQRQGYVQKSGTAWCLTPEGWERGKRVARLHRLWEVYLTRHLQIAPDHVHDDAETIEHILTPALEEQLAAELGYPVVDPHNTPIPYKHSVQKRPKRA